MNRKTWPEDKPEIRKKFYRIDSLGNMIGGYFSNKKDLLEYEKIFKNMVFTWVYKADWLLEGE